jgi:cation diffusion facilitator family transporter
LWCAGLKQNSLKEGGAIAQKTFFIVLAVSLIEILVGMLSLSVALIADGVHSLAIALVFLIVWIGLRLSGRSPDGTFHFGYYRFETLGSLIAAFFMVAFGGLVIFESYSVWLNPRRIINPEVAMAVALGATVTAVLISVWIQGASKKYGSTSLRTGALNGATDAAASSAAFVSIVLSSYFGIMHADSVAGMLIALAVFAVAYSIIRESSLVLVDACHCGDVVTAIGDVAKSIKGIKEVHSIRMRKLGPYLVGDMHIVVSSDMLVREADLIATQVEEKIKQEFNSIIELKIRIESDEAHDIHAKEFTVKKT